MKPEYYSQSQYIKIYELFSSPFYSPIGNKIIKHLLENISKQLLKKKYIKIYDIGAGSGFFTTLSLIQCKEHWNQIFVTLSEPNQDMRSILLKKLPQFKNKSILPFFAEESLERTKHQDIYLFHRCLYAFYKKDELYKYQILINKLYEKTNNDGVVIIHEIFRKYNVEEIKKYSYNNRKKIGLSEKKMKQYFPILKETLEEFNFQSDKGEITLLSKDFLIKIFKKSGFTIILNERSILIFQKTNQIIS